MSSFRLFLFVNLIHGLSASAETLSVPENCLAQEIAPCLIKAETNQTLKSKSKLFQLAVSSGSIVKIVQFNIPFKFDLLNGKVSIQAISKKPIQFKLNDVAFESKAVFAKSTEVGRLQIYDVKNFILAEYELSGSSEQESVLRKSEFLAKLDMIRYLSEFYTSKKSFLGYLKSIETLWKKELNRQTNDQTIALQRSIASIAKAEELSKAQAEKEAEELKKVRRQFFYRTFYR